MKTRVVSLLVAGAVLASASEARADLPVPSTAKQADQHFMVDPLADSMLIGGSLTFAGILGLILGTGEIRPTLPGPESNLLSIDRNAVDQTPDKNANTFSDIGLYTAVGFAVLDPILSGFRDGKDAGLVDAMMYAESLSLTLLVTDITKIAVRRPRPVDYVNCPFNDPATATKPECTGPTNNELSFFSGHASTVGAVTGTATYLAFVRSPHTARPWITLGVGTALTAFVGFERVRGGDHFPTDVVTGALTGAAIGVLIPHLHRHSEEAPPVWVGFEQAPGGGTLSLSGLF